MRFLVIGLGSMGKRRIRNLQSLGYKNIAGFDIREDRLDEAVEKYSITPFTELDQAIAKFQPDACVISTSPGQHMVYADRALVLGVSCFIEASVTDAEKIKALGDKAKSTSTLILPSCTMRYFPGPCKVKELLEQGVIGEVFNFNYHTGQYLPDWHPWESITDYYVSKSETGGCREIVPFELTWLNDIFGEPKPLACVKGKLTKMATEIDDIYHCLLKYPGDVLANMTVEVISRPVATREMRVLGSEGEIVLSADQNCVRWINCQMKEWEHFSLRGGTVEDQYINPEEPYIAEMKDFVDAVAANDASLFPNSLADDYRVLQNLYRLEQLNGENG